MASYDYKLRCSVGESDNDQELVAAVHSKHGDFFGWYEGEVVMLTIEHHDHILRIKLDKKGNLSLKRTEK